MASLGKLLAAFFVWMVTSFLCHKLAKEAVDCFLINVTSLPRVTAPVFVTICQIAVCYSTVNFSDAKSPLFSIMAAAHVIATLATNTSFAFIFASSAMVVKLLEPLTSAFIQSLVLRTRTPPGKDPLCVRRVLESYWTN